MVRRQDILGNNIISNIISDSNIFNMDTIKVLKCEAKTTKNGKPYKALEVECAGEVRKVNMWSNFPNYANIAEGGVFEAKMTKEGQYWNLSYEGSNGGGNRGYGASGGTKKEDIKEAQEKKAEDIALAGAQRDAVLIVTMIYNNLEYPNQSEDAIKDHIIRWRNWFLSDEFKKSAPPF